jgi:SPP1 family predicted phage head-tail adaptor
MSPNIGDMRHRVWLQSKSETRDAEGGVVSSWNSIANLWASINPMSGRELQIAQQMQSQSTIKIIIRWQSSFGFNDLTKMRFISDLGQIFQIEQQLEENYLHHFITLYCKTITGRNPNAVLVDETTSEPLLIGLY